MTYNYFHISNLTNPPQPLGFSALSALTDDVHASTTHKKTYQRVGETYDSAKHIANRTLGRAFNEPLTADGGDLISNGTSGRKLERMTPLAWVTTTTTAASTLIAAGATANKLGETPAQIDLVANSTQVYIPPNWLELTALARSATEIEGLFAGSTNGSSSIIVSTTNGSIDRTNLRIATVSRNVILKAISDVKTEMRTDSGVVGTTAIAAKPFDYIGKMELPLEAAALPSQFNPALDGSREKARRVRARRLQ
jgi:hypothetical protein